jgi:hypothetical protein
MNLFPTSYFPSISYFKAVNSCPEPVISGNELYVKQTFRNRCEVFTGNGIQALSVPICKSEGSKSLTKDLKIVQNPSWRKDHWGAIKSAYQNAPYFEFYDCEIYDLIHAKHEFLLDLNEDIINFMNETFDLKKIQYSQENISHEIAFDFLDRRSNSKEYVQVFSDRFPFQSNLSILDLIFCEGPIGRKFILAD